MFEVIPADRIVSPGANKSTHEPKLENDARASPMVLAATMSASPVALAGDDAHASTFALPAAPTTTMPSPRARVMAESSAALVVPPRLRFITAGLVVWSAIAQSIPSTTPETVPDPWQSRTRTATRLTAGATPRVEPPTVPATWVPWPWQSMVLPANASKPARTREPNWAWVARIPVSTM